MYHGQKSDMLNDCIDPNRSRGNAKPKTSCAILDGGVMIHMLWPKDSITIRQYCLDVISPHVSWWLRDNTRVDWVKDRCQNDGPYGECSL